MSLGKRFKELQVKQLEHQGEEFSVIRNRHSGDRE